MFALRPLPPVPCSLLPAPLIHDLEVFTHGGAAALEALPGQPAHDAAEAVGKADGQALEDGDECPRKEILGVFRRAFEAFGFGFFVSGHSNKRIHDANTVVVLPVV